MGYLAQKKKNFRDEIALKMLAVILSTITFIPLLFGDFLSITNILFVIYLFIIIVLCYSIIVRRFVFSLIFAILLLINYFYISSSAILFFAPQKQSDNMVSIQYSSNGLTIKDTNVIQKGFLKLNDIYAFFNKVKIANSEQIVLGINLSDTKNIDKTLSQLRKFVINQDCPVVIVGDFSLPAWSPLIKKFLDDTNLSVKNSLLFVSPKGNLTFSPSYNILAFKNANISDIKIIKHSQKGERPSVVFNFDPNNN